MNAIARTQAAALIATLGEEARRRAFELDAAAATECQRIEREARREARARLHAALAAKRRRIAERCRAVEVEWDTTSRAREFGRARELAERALAALPAALAARWARAAERAAWCRTTVGVAVRVLRAREWVVELPATVAHEERGALEGLAAAGGARIVEFRDLATDVGIRIGSATTWVDASRASLCRDRARLAAEFLAALEAAETTP